ELNKRAAEIASILESKGVMPGDIVGIMIERSIEMITGIMAILKTRAAYLPIAPTFPGQRIRYMLEDSKTKILLSDSGKRLSKPDLTGKPITCIEVPITINTDTSPVHPVHEPVPNIRHPASGIAYIIYTSGTTGKPKGVAVPHSAAVNRLYWVREKYQLDKSDVVVQKTAITFDVSVCELFRWLLPGAALYLLPEGGEKEPGAIIIAIEKHHATTVDFVPSMLTVFMEEVKERGMLDKLRTLRWVFVGAETLPPELAETFIQTIGSRSDTRLINAYGPTEATVDVTWFDCAAAANYETVPIGKPMANTTLLVLDKYRRLQPPGIPGELCIAGQCLAAGYLNQPELTGEKFINFKLQETKDKTYPGNQYPITNNVFYHTGDLVRWLPDGNIDFLGRIDHQVKIRGYRIELGEIENTLLSNPIIKETIVLAKRDKENNNYLAAYYVPKAPDAKGTKISQLRVFLSEKLPGYMVPAYFIPLDKLPLTSHGKIDRKALPEPETTARLSKVYVAPISETEKKLAAIWQDVLGTP
ncbi:MAG: amino acid adenylation domain-containing protein, partial [bacterium]|nr:amino acid adenylation domain-containing protein [bacterium]